MKMHVHASISESRLTTGLYQPATIILSPGGRSMGTAMLKGCQLTPKVCITTPLNASMRRMKLPLVEMRMSLPSLLNLSPVHSQVRSYCILKVANGPWNDKNSSRSQRPINIPSARANSYSVPLDSFWAKGRTIALTFSNVYHIPPLPLTFSNVYHIPTSTSSTMEDSHLTLQNLHDMKIAPRLKDLPYQKSEDHKVWPFQNWHLQQKLTLLDQRNKLACLVDAWGPMKKIKKTVNEPRILPPYNLLFPMKTHRRTLTDTCLSREWKR